MKIKTKILFLIVIAQFHLCLAQESQNDLPKVINHLNGELDYTNEALELVTRQANGEEVSLGKINTDGTIRFNLPEFDIKALFDSIPLQPNKFQNWFSINSDCKDRDAFAETTFDDVYSMKYDPIFIKKYGVNIAALYPVSDEKMVSRNNNQRAILPAEAKYFWFYIDKALTFKEECTIISISTGNISAEIRANIKFEKGWNFIEENLVEIQNVVQVDSQTTTVRTIEFKRSSPAFKKVKWFIKQFKEDEEIQALKKLYNLTPISKVQFETWAPNKLGNLSVTTKEYGNPPKGRKNKNNIHLIYTNESQKREIDLYVVDFSKSPDDLEMIDFAYAMENNGKDEKDIKPYIAQYNEQENITQLWYKVGDRMFVEASGVDINAEELWGYIQKLKVEKLLNKQAAAEVYNKDATTVKFEGTITNAKNDCWADGTCSVEVNNKWWIAIVYGKRDPSSIPKERGTYTGIRFTKDNESIGKKVKVYAKIKKNNHLTLEGSNLYYVKTQE